MMRLGILGSTRGTNMLAIIEAIRKGALAARIELVISNKSDALILDRARANGLNAEYLNPASLSRSEYDQCLDQLLKKHQVDLLVLIGYMRILSADFVTQWDHQIINVHPSLLPAHAGLMDLTVHQAVLDAKDKETGCTIHYVTPEVDAGPILLQMKCPVLENDSAESLKERVQALEGPALIAAISHHQQTLTRTTF